jgi:hypothetical protein
MIKKMLWLVILVLVAACSVYVKDTGAFDTGGLLDTPVAETATATTNPICPVLPTATGTLVTPVEPTATIEITQTATAPALPTATGTTAPTALPTATGTTAPTALPTTTSTVLPTATATSTTLPTATATSTQVPTAMPPTATTAPTITATSAPMAFSVQATTPVYMVNFVYTSKGCKWQGVAGQVFDSAGKPLTNYVVKVTGSYNGSTISKVGVTGMVSGTPYGPGSYEIVLGSTAINSIDLLSIQVFDPNGKILTTPLKFSTSADCNKNLVIINFQQN